MMEDGNVIGSSMAILISGGDEQNILILTHEH
jgi:hypothetical protein